MVPATCFAIKEPGLLSTQFIYGFRAIVTISNDYFLKQP
jgi:hypothetical protein